MKDPAWVDAILEWRWTWLFARFGLTSPYFISGIVKLTNFSAASVEQENFGLHPGWAWAVVAIVVELISPLFIVAGRLVWFGAGALGILTAVATFVAFPFWTMQGQARFLTTNIFFEHIGLIAGLVIAAILAEHEARRSSNQNL